ncbi:GatB/YqeY domain-containing protein [Haliangium sp.]|uniref:GatB/YqeY domain-containing protein n=1 Tax=Haliangium sp. TaxID=2663208 RepID=UPI003D0D123D
MSIEQTLRTKLTAAMKAKDSRTANVIRMIDTKVMERRTAKGFKGEVDDALYLDVIGAYQKSMSKALGEYEAMGDKGAEQVEQLRFEVEFCAQFLPQPLGEDEIRAAVQAAIAELGASDPKMAGRVLGAVMKAHKGRVDAAVVKRLVDEALS